MTSFPRYQAQLGNEVKFSHSEHPDSDRYQDSQLELTRPRSQHPHWERATSELSIKQIRLIH